MMRLYIFQQKTNVFLKKLWLLAAFLMFSSSAIAQVWNGDITLSSQGQVNQFANIYAGSKQINGNLTISGVLINNLNGLSNITSVSGNLIIQSNLSLTNLTGLNSLVNLGGLSILQNTNLSDISALGNISNPLINLTITNNPSLSACSIAPICRYLSNGFSGSIFSNGTAGNGCESASQIIANCSPVPCPEPYFVNTMVSGITQTQALISWYGNTALSYDIEWGTTGFTQGTGTRVNNIVLTSQTISGLAAGKTYDVYLRRNCGNSNSSWAKVSFTTLAPPCETPAAPTATNATACAGATSATLGATTSVTETIDLGNTVVPGGYNAFVELNGTVSSIPSGATITSAKLIFNGVTTAGVGAIWVKDFKVSVSGTATTLSETALTNVNGGATNGGPYTVNLPNNLVNGAFTVKIKNNSLGYNATLTINSVKLEYTYTLPPATINWYADATGDSVIATGATYEVTDATKLAIAGTYTYYATTDNGTCESARTPVTLTVNPVPSVPIATNATVTEGATTATLGATTSATSVKWYNVATGGSVLATGATYEVTNPTQLSTAGTYTYYAAASNGTCESARTPVTLTVNPGLTMDQPANQEVRHGDNTEAVTFTSAEAGVTYDWTNNTTSIGLPASGTGNIPSFVASNTTDKAVTATITVTPKIVGEGILDINQASKNVFLSYFNSGDIAQSFKAVSNSISGAGIDLGPTGGNSTVTIELWDKLPNQTGAIKLATGSSPATPNSSIDVSWSPVSVTPGTTYYLVITSTDDNNVLLGDSNNPYVDGQMYASVGYFSWPNFDFAFRVYKSGTILGTPKTFTIKVNPITLNVYDIHKKEITVYPNPFAEIINLSDIENVDSIIINDLSGRLIKTIKKPTKEINFSHTVSGVYIINVKFKDGNEKAFKVIKK